MKKRWYLETWVIAICFFFGIFGIPALIGIVLIILRAFQDKNNLKIFNQLSQDFSIQKNELEQKIQELSIQNKTLEEKIQNLEKHNEEIGLTTYEEVINEIETLRSSFESEKQSHEQIISDQKARIAYNTAESQNIYAQIVSYDEELRKKEKQIQTQVKKISRIKELYKSIEYCLNNFLDYIPSDSSLTLPKSEALEFDELAPSVILKLHSMDTKDLRTAFRENEKQIDEVLTEYASRYTTKSNIAIYKLMVIALKAELQNILSNLKYEKLDNAIQQVQATTAKYLKIAGNGNQTIITTLTKFIGQIEYLFINAVKIEYNYYIKKEQAKQEQLALREQMRQEAEERKALEAERKKIEKEEEKYHTEIDKLNEQMTSASDTEIEQLKARILELQSQLSDVIVKKEEIATLANGKAGNVYIISNLGAFGDNVFKIGMTRRLDPQERVNELGSASVPFKFDVHSFIFSNDAVSLENKLHTMLNDKRVNKVNTRKEFFRVTIDELEKLVNEIEPTAEFNRTMAAEEYYQTQSLAI